MTEYKVIGPTLPIKTETETGDSNKANELYGPALPPGFKNPVTKEVDIGPQVPRKISTDSEDDDDDDKSSVIGPQLPPGFQPTSKDDTSSEESDEDGLIGPRPYEGDDQSLETVKEEFDKRAQRMKNKLSGVTGTKIVQREEWMTNLPPQLKPTFGVGPRTFKRRNEPENTDTSCWTTVQGENDEKETKIKEKVLTKNEVVPDAKDQQLSDFVKDYNEKSRSESLLDMHQKNRKRKLPEGPQERRPFDRSIDLERVHFSEAQKNALIKRSHQLNDRFSAGKSKFL